MLRLRYRDHGLDLDPQKRSPISGTKHHDDCSSKHVSEMWRGFDWTEEQQLENMTSTLTSIVFLGLDRWLATSTHLFLCAVQAIFGPNSKFDPNKTFQPDAVRGA